MAGVTIRQVTAEDYEDVVNIRDVYEGRDYLPGLFHEIIKRHDGFGAFVGEKMVSYFKDFNLFPYKSICLLSETRCPSVHLFCTETSRVVQLVREVENLARENIEVCICSFHSIQFC